VIPPRQKFLDFFEAFAWRHGVPNPKTDVLLRFRVEAMVYDERSKNPACEAAAMYFALSLGKRRLTSSTCHIFPIAIALFHLFEHGMTIREPRALAWLRIQVAKKSASWPIVRTWFVDRCEERRLLFR
jgi:hypothetical protein